MTFHLADLDGQLGRQSMRDPRIGHSTQTLSHLAAQQYQLKQALNERRRQRRAAKAQASRSRRQPVARTA